MSSKLRPSDRMEDLTIVFENDISIRYHFNQIRFLKIHTMYNNIPAEPFNGYTSNRSSLAINRPDHYPYNITLVLTQSSKRNVQAVPLQENLSPEQSLYTIQLDRDKLFETFKIKSMILHYSSKRSKEHSISASGRPLNTIHQGVHLLDNSSLLISIVDYMNDSKFEEYFTQLKNHWSDATQKYGL